MPKWPKTHLMNGENLKVLMPRNPLQIWKKMRRLLWNWWTCCPCSFFKLLVPTCQQIMNP